MPRNQALSGHGNVVTERKALNVRDEDNGAAWKPPHPTITISPAALLALGESMARRRLQQKGDLTRKNGWWLLRWREDVREPNGGIRRQWSKQVVVGPAAGNPSGLPGLTKKQAERLAWANFLSKLDQVQQKPASISTFAEFIERKYKPEHLSGLRKQSRISAAGRLDNHILPVLGEMRMRDITRDDCQRVIATAAGKGLSVQTQTHLRNLMSSVFSLAEDCEWTVGNPARRVRLPKLTFKQRIPLTWDQVETAAAAMPKYADLVRFLALTGLRIGEALGLRWRWVNLTGEFQGQLPPYSFGVVEQFSNGEWLPGTKSNAGLRIIPLTTASYTILDDAKQRTKFGLAEHTVWTNRNGGPLDSHNVANRWMPAAKKALGMPGFSFHSLRHTAATLADQAGVTLAERMKLLGHAGSAMGLRYTHADAETVREKLERVQ